MAAQATQAASASVAQTLSKTTPWLGTPAVLQMSAETATRVNEVIAYAVVGVVLVIVADRALRRLVRLRYRVL